MTNTNSKVTRLWVLAVVIILTSCSANTVSQMKKAGNSPLDAKSIQTLFTDQTFHFEAVDFDANLTFHDRGHLSGVNQSSETDTGIWATTAEDMLCIKFTTWYFGDANCYTVFTEDDGRRYILFTRNGARYYTATPLNANKVGKSGDIAGQEESVTKNSISDNDLNTQHESRNLPSQPPSQPDSSEMKFILANTARDCPECDLSGLDLSESNLADAILSNATLSGTNFHSSDLRRAKLSGADLSGANLTDTNLSRAKLRGCNLRNADLSGANLTLTDFTGSDLTGTILQGAHLDRTTGIH